MCENPVLLVNPTALKLWHVAKSIEVNGNKYDSLTLSLSEVKSLVGFFNDKNERESDPKKIDYIINNNFIYVELSSLSRIPIFIAGNCGSCRYCLDSKRKEYEARALFEASDCPNMYFWTLTYNDNHLPSDGLLRHDVSSFLKRLRTNLSRAYSRKFGCTESEAREYLQFRCVYCGEYGPTKTKRPHYHGLIFFRNPIADKYVPWLNKIFVSSWGKGKIYDFQKVKNPAASARYICKYITKSNICDGPKGKNPCFFQGPMKCGLGALNLASHLEDILNSNSFSIKLNINGNVVSTHIPKFIINKIFPTFSRVYGSLNDLFFKLYNIRQNLLDEIPEESELHPRHYDFVFNKFNYLVAGSRSRCSKKLQDLICTTTDSKEFTADCVNTYFKEHCRVSAEDYRDTLLSLLDHLPTEREFFLEFCSKYIYLQKLLQGSLTFDEKLKIKTKNMFNNINFVNKRMLSGDFDLLLQI